MESHTQQAAVRFNRWANSYGNDRLAGWFQFYQQLALSKLSIEAGSGFLEVGCASGWAVRHAAMHLRSGMSCGIDISPKMINKAIALSVEFPNTEFRVANAESIPYPDETFDSVLCTNSFHHYEHPRMALDEIRRVTKAGGRFALLDSSRNVSLAIWLQDRWRRYMEKSHVRYYTTTEIRRLLQESGWVMVADVMPIRAFMSHKKMFTGLALAVCEK